MQAPITAGGHHWGANRKVDPAVLLQVVSVDETPLLNIALDETFGYRRSRSVEVFCLFVLALLIILLGYLAGNQTDWHQLVCNF